MSVTISDRLAEHLERILRQSADSFRDSPSGYDRTEWGRPTEKAANALSLARQGKAEPNVNWPHEWERLQTHRGY